MQPASLASRPDDPLQRALAELVRRAPQLAHRRVGQHQDQTVTHVLRGNRPMAGTLARVLRALIDRAATRDEAEELVALTLEVLGLGLRGAIDARFGGAPAPAFGAAHDAETRANWAADLALIEALRTPGVDTLARLRDRLLVQARRSYEAAEATEAVLRTARVA